MAATLPKEAAAMCFQMPDQIDPLHGLSPSGDEALANDLSATEIFFR